MRKCKIQAYILPETERAAPCQALPTGQGGQAKLAVDGTTTAPVVLLCFLEAELPEQAFVTFVSHKDNIILLF